MKIVNRLKPILGSLAVLFIRLAAKRVLTFKNQTDSQFFFKNI